MPTLRPFAVLALAALAGAAGAQTHTIYIGGASLDINSKAPPLEGGPAVPPPGALVRVGDAKTVTFGYIYRFAPQWSVEAALGVPPEHKGYGEGFLKAFGQISAAKQVAPTVFLNFHPAITLGPLQPFVGIGLNHTRFTDERSTASGDAASGGPTTIKLGSSTGLAAHLGVTMPLQKNISFSATIGTADVSSELTATTTTTGHGTIVRRTTIDFRPTVYTATLNYGF